MLYAEVSGSGPRLVLVHGFAQNRNCWGQMADDLERDHEVVRIDAPGHGQSAEFYAGLRTGARLIADQGGPATYLGYSMGARFVLHVSLALPELVHGLVLVGGMAGIDDPAARAQRAHQDELMAERLERDGLEPFLEAWLAQPLFAGLSEPMQFRKERLENTADGLAESLRQAGTGVQDPLWDRLHRLAMPALVVAGDNDAKYSAKAHRLAESIGSNAELQPIPDAGHAAHLERPDEFLTVLRAWLARHGL